MEHTKVIDGAMAMIDAFKTVVRNGMDTLPLFNELAADASTRGPMSEGS